MLPRKPPSKPPPILRNKLPPPKGEDDGYGVERVNGSPARDVYGEDGEFWLKALPGEGEEGRAGAEKLREPRLPDDRPPPTRASARTVKPHNKTRKTAPKRPFLFRN